MQKEFLSRVLRMIAKKHKIDFTNVIWMISFVLFILAILGVVSTTGNLCIASIVLLGFVIVLYFWHFLIAIPAEVLREAEEEAQPMLALRKIQTGNEEKWLRPVIEWIDFEREGSSLNKVMIAYQIDSGLVYDFKPYRMWIKLRIGQYEPKDGWEILQPQNLLKGKRSQFPSETYTIDDDLLKMIERCRHGLKIAQTLKIIVQLRDREPLKVLESSYSINPYSDIVEVNEP